MKPGEPVPEHIHELRYKSRGYVIVRWTISPILYVEIPEHRLVMGNPPNAEVHHKNKQRDDNRPSNLEIISKVDHRTHHGKERRLWDASELTALYQSGWSTKQLAKRYDCNHSNIYRALVRMGIEPRKRGTFTDAQRKAISEASKRAHQNTDVLAQKQRSLRRVWAERTQAQRSIIGQHISEAKRAKHS